MKTAGVIGLGDMGSGLAKNLIKNGFETSGFDLSETRMTAFTDMDGMAKDSVGQVGRHAAAVFVMVMNGDQARDVILGEDGLVANWPKAERSSCRRPLPRRSKRYRARHGGLGHPPD